MEDLPAVESGGRGRRGRGRRGVAGEAPHSSGEPVAAPTEAPDDPSPMTSSDEEAQTHLRRPRRIMDRSTSIARREDELAQALVVTVFGNCLDESADAVLATIAQRAEIELDRLSIRHFGPASFLIILPAEDVAVRVFNDGRPIVTPSHRLYVRRWSRFLDSTAGSLDVAIEIELRGVPAHAWELSTAELLLNEFVWIGGVLPVA